MRSVELFAGAGGLAIAMSNAGFRHAAVIERNHDACETFRENQRLDLHAVNKWLLYEGDVQDFDYRGLSDIAVVSGGPPCQPFSLGGKHRGHSDKRDMFPEAVRAVHELRPKAFLFENVKGLMRETFASYFEYILLRFAHPSVTRRKSESPRDHCAQLERHHTSRRTRTEYNVVFRLLNAADFGVPQRRERVFIVGFRSDLGVQWSFPEGDHSEDALLHSKWVTGEYWHRHRLTKRRRPELPPRLMARVQRLSIASMPNGNPWRTVRDSINDLPEPQQRRSSAVANHVFNPGARSYPGHTGSPIDDPAKTLKAGDHGVPGGENMLALPNGSVRYFTVREAARLQTFPDDYVFCGSWTESMRQLGNAVPVQLAERVAKSVSDALHRSRSDGV